MLKFAYDTLFRGVREEDANVNVLCVKLDQLGTAETAVTESASCNACGARLSDLNRLAEGACDFCGPTLSDAPVRETSTDYVVVPAVDARPRSDDAVPAIILCIDHSGSMCGGLLDAVAKASVQQIKAAPEVTKIGIIAFEGNITVFGDGSSAPVTVRGDDALNDPVELARVAQSMPLSEHADRRAVLDFVEALQTLGCTALGPAAFIAVEQAIACGAGSKVVLCTDGMANVGLGSMGPEAAPDAYETFYRGLGERARDAGVIVDITTVGMGTCNIESVGVLASLTGGEVIRAKYDASFHGSFSRRLVARDVRIKVRGKGVSLSDAAGRLVRDDVVVGSVASGQQISFALRASEPEILLQFEISFTKLDGSRCVRVLSARRSATDGVPDVAAADVDVLKMHALRGAGALTGEDLYEEAADHLKKWGQVVPGMKDAMESDTLLDDTFSQNVRVLSRGLTRGITEGGSRKKARTEDDEFSAAMHTASRMSA